jgi:hypothetical protein
MSEAQDDAPTTARSGTGGAGGPMEMCPMAEMCRGLTGKPPSLLLLMIPGAALVLGGVLILLVPAALVWLMAATSIVIGLAMLAMAGFVRRFATQLGESPTG